MTKGGIIFGGVLPTFAFGFMTRRELSPSTSGSLSHKSPAVLQKRHKETHPFRSGLFASLGESRIILSLNEYHIFTGLTSGATHAMSPAVMSPIGEAFYEQYSTSKRVCQVLSKIFILTLT